MAAFWDTLTGKVNPLDVAPVDVTAALQTGYASPYADNSHLADVVFSDIFPELAGHIHVNRDRALSISVVAKARNLITTQLSRMPLRANTVAGRVHHEQPAWLRELEAGRPTSTTIIWLADQLIFHPFAHLIVRERYADGFPRRFTLVERSKATYDTNGYDLIAYDDAPVAAGDAIRIDAPTSGLLNVARDDIRRALILTAAAQQAEDNPVPVLNLANNGDEALNAGDVADLLDSWQAARRRRGVSYTPKGIDLEQYGAKSEALLIDGQKRLDIVLARHMNVAAWMVDAPIEGSSLNYSNRASRNWELIDLTLAPYMTAIADRLSLDDITRHGTTLAFDTDVLVREDRKTRYETYKLGLDGGFLQVADVRRLEQLDDQEPTA